MDKYKRLLSNTAILGIGTVTSKLLVLLLLPVYTECLTKAEYGVADIITQSANLLMPLISLGICEAVFRYTLDTANDRREVLTTGFVIILFGLGVMLALYPLLDTIEFFDGYMWLIILKKSQMVTLILKLKNLLVIKPYLLTLLKIFNWH